MDWRIEVAKATLPADLKSALEASRDEWVKTTPQASSYSNSEYALLDQMINDKFDAARAPFVKQKADKVAADSSTLDATHTEIVRQMNAGVAAAVALVKTMPADSYVRASVSGHYKPGHESFLDERLSVDVDQCRPPVAK